MTLDEMKKRIEQLEIDNAKLKQRLGHKPGYQGFLLPTHGIDRTVA